MRGSERLLAILSCLGAARGQTLSMVADQVGLPRPTALRFLRSLEEEGWVTRDPDGRYALGPAVLTLASQYLGGDDLVAAASGEMLLMRDQLGETISLSRLAGHRRVCVQEFPSTASLRLALGLGAFGPLHAGASGLVLLAALPAAEQDAVLAGPLEAYTEATITSPKALRRECARVREQGWSVTRGQRTPGGVAVAVPVRDAGAPSGTSALAIYAPAARSSPAAERRWIETLLRSAAVIENSVHTHTAVS